MEKIPGVNGRSIKKLQSPGFIKKYSDMQEHVAE